MEKNVIKYSGKQLETNMKHFTTKSLASFSL